MTEQYYRMTLSDVIAQYKAKLISSTTLLYYYLKIKLAPGWKMTLHQRPICKELGISKAAFYKGIQRLKNKNLIDWEAPNGLVVSLEPIGDCLDKLETVGQIGDCLDKLETPVDKLETVGQIGDCLDKLETPVDKLETPVDKLETPVDKLETPVDKLETSTLPKPSHSNSSGDSPDYYQIFNNSLSDSEREKFLEFGLKKAALLPKPPTLQQKWVQKNFQELYSQFRQEFGEAISPSQNWENHPCRDEWLLEMRTKGTGAFIGLAPSQERSERLKFREWAKANHQI